MNNLTIERRRVFKFGGSENAWEHEQKDLSPAAEKIAIYAWNHGWIRPETKFLSYPAVYKTTD